MKTKIMILALVILGSQYSCKTTKVQSNACSSMNLSYAKDIKSILDANCASSCHSAAKRKHNIDLSSLEVVKIEAAQRRFMGSIRHEDSYDAMPADHPKLDDATIQKLSCWIENGMKE